MKASKLIVLGAGILGILAFFLPFVTVEHRGQQVSASAFQVVKGLETVQEGAKELRTSSASMSRADRKAIDDADDKLGAIKGFVVAVFVPALLLALIGGLGVMRKQFGRVAGTFSLLIGLIGLGIGALLHAAASEAEIGAGIGITLVLLTGVAGMIGGILALAKPERAAARA